MVLTVWSRFLLYTIIKCQFCWWYRKKSYVTFNKRKRICNKMTLVYILILHPFVCPFIYKFVQFTVLCCVYNFLLLSLSVLIMLKYCVTIEETRIKCNWSFERFLFPLLLNNKDLILILYKKLMNANKKRENEFEWGNEMSAELQSNI